MRYALSLAAALYFPACAADTRITVAECAELNVDFCDAVLIPDDRCPEGMELIAAISDRTPAVCCRADETCVIPR